MTKTDFRKLGILINADDYYFNYFKKESTKRAAFKVTSGTYQKDFISLWKFFHHKEKLDKFLQRLARKAMAIRQEKYFNAIVTATPTGKHLMNQIHAIIEQKSSIEGEIEEDEITIHYVGPYPSVHEYDTKLHTFENKKVLILTDVISSGTLVNDVIKTVEELGGIPEAVLCAFLVNREKIKMLGSKNDSYVEKYGKHQRKLRVYRIYQCDVSPLEPAEFDKDKIIRIDPLTVLPERGIDKNIIAPLFNFTEMFEHFEDSKSIDFSLYEVDGRKFITAFRVPLLLKTFGDSIIGRIKDNIVNAVPRDFLPVTTYSRADLIFQEFVADNLRGYRKNFRQLILVPRKDEHSGVSYDYFPPINREGEFRDRHALLLVASVHGLEKLRNLVSLLASYEVKGITVICLFNRMGYNTQNFISRIRNLLKGIQKIENGRNIGQLPFRFIPVYNVPEFNVDDIWEMQYKIHSLFQHYEKNTKVPSFRNLMKQYPKYFKSKSVTSRRFLNSTPIPYNGNGSKAKFFNDTPVTIKSEDGNLFLISNNLIFSKDYSELIKELDRITEKATLFKVFGLLLADVNFLRLKGYFEELRTILVNRINKTRDERFALESGDHTTEIKNKIDLESNLLFGMALFSFLDHRFDYDAFIVETFTCGKKPEEWDQYPNNWYLYFSDERILWNISFLMHLSHTDFHEKDVAKNLKESIKQTIRAYIKHFDEKSTRDDKNGKLKKANIRFNLDLLLAEIGEHELQNKHQIIRYLHRTILASKVWHNPIYNTISKLVQQLTDIHGMKQNLGKTRHIHFLKMGDNVVSKQIQEYLIDAVSAVGEMEALSVSANRLFDFTPISRNELGIFKPENGKTEFHETVLSMSSIISDARINNSISFDQIQKLRRCKATIDKGLWDEISPLRKTLFEYIVPIRHFLITSMEEANLFLNGIGFNNVWINEIEKLKNMTAEPKILIQRQFLRELLRNVLTNVRHTFAGIDRGNSSYSDLVKVDFVPTPASEEVEHLTIKISSLGNKFVPLSDDDKRTSTLFQQREELREYDGDLTITELKEISGTEVRLRFRSRDDLAMKLDMKRTSIY